MNKEGKKRKKGKRAKDLNKWKERREKKAAQGACSGKLTFEA